MSTKIRDDMSERIVGAALAVLRKGGWSALTRPRVARAAGLRQSHLAYYFPTRSDLVTAVSREVARRLLDGFDRVVGGMALDPSGFGKSFAGLCSPEQTRLLPTLVRAAERIAESLKRADAASGFAMQGLSHTGLGIAARNRIFASSRLTVPLACGSLEGVFRGPLC